MKVVANRFTIKKVLHVVLQTNEADPTWKHGNMRTRENAGKSKYFKYMTTIVQRV